MVSAVAPAALHETLLTSSEIHKHHTLFLWLILYMFAILAVKKVQSLFVVPINY